MQKILFHQDNAPAHKAIKTTTELTELKYELLTRKRFYSNEEVIAERNVHFEDYVEE